MWRIASSLLLAIWPAMHLHAACSGSYASRPAPARVIDHYITDNILHRRWAILVDCSHPERPWTMEEVPFERKTATGMGLPPHPARLRLQAAPLVPAGAKVQLWRTGKDASIHLLGSALDAGDEGQMIHVRVEHSTAVLVGKVRGAGSVELTAPDRWKSQ